MKSFRLRKLAPVVLLALALVPGLAQAQAPQPAALATVYPNSFTYQGQLRANGALVNGTCDFEFSLYDSASGGTLIDVPHTVNAVQVTNGLFTINDLFFAEWAFYGQLRWLSIGVKCPAGTPGAYTYLSPRQPLTGAPLALSLMPGAATIGSVSAYFKSAIYGGNTLDTGLGYGVTGRSAAPEGAGIHGVGDGGASGGNFASYGGHALVTDESNSLINGPNPKQIGMLRWWKANRAQYPIYVGANPDQMIFDGETIWVTSWGAGQVTQIRPSDGKILQTIGGLNTPNPLAYDTYALWVGSESTPAVSIVDPRLGIVANTLGTANGIPNSGHWGMAFDGEYMWVTNHATDSVTKIRAGDKNVIGSYPTGHTPMGVIFDGTYIYVANQGSNTVTQLNTDGSTRDTYPVGSAPMGMAFDGAYIWVANSGSANLTRLTRDGAIAGTYAVEPGPFFVAFDGYHIWSTHYTDWGKVTRLDAADGSNYQSYTIGHYPMGIVFDGANVWVTISQQDFYITKF